MRLLGSFRSYMVVWAEVTQGPLYLFSALAPSTSTTIRDDKLVSDASSSSRINAWIFVALSGSGLVGVVDCIRRCA